MTGENEWTKSTNDQVAHLFTLINSLVAYLVGGAAGYCSSDVDFSYITEDTAEDFKGPVIQMVNLCHGHHTGYSCKAERALFELVIFLLVDNANKYCDPEGTVTVRLRQIGRT